MRFQTKSPERKTVEYTLALSTEPLTVRQIIDMTGLESGLVYRCMSAIVKAKQAHCVNPGHRAVSQFRWGRQPPPVRDPLVAQSRSYVPSEPLRIKPSQVREGSLRAFELPSLHEGQRIERRPPIIIGGRLSNNDKWAQQ